MRTGHLYCLINSKNIHIVGAGWLGKPLAIHLKKKGFIVTATNRTNKNKTEFISFGITHHTLDLDNPKSINLQDFKSDTLIFCAAYKKPENFKAFLHSLKQTYVKKIVFISSTSVYKSNNNIIVEDSERQHSVLRQMEDSLLDSPFQTIILRLSGLVGYNRHPKNFINYSMPMRSPNGVINWVHRDDCIAIIEGVINRKLSSNIFNVCASAHPKRIEIYSRLANHFNINQPIFEENNSQKFKHVSNNKIKKELDYKFKYDDFEFLFNNKVVL